MQQLTYVKPRELAWRDVPEPRLQGPKEALVRPFVAARCDGDSFFLHHDFEPWMRVGAALHLVDAAFGSAAEDPFAGSFPYGHECVAEVVEVGEAVRDHAVGDVVVVPWAVSCGSCGHCASGLTAHCQSASKPVAAYGFGEAIGGYGGMVSDRVRVPYADAMLVSVPDSVDPLSVASAGDNMADAYRAVAPALEQAPEASVLIIGGAAKSIGLYSTAIAVALGASRVHYVDSCPARLGIAERYGAHPIQVSGVERWLKASRSIHTTGYGVAVEASGTTAGLNYALKSLVPGGVCTAVAFYVRRGTPLPLWEMYMKSATLRIGLSHSRVHLPALLGLVERRAFDPSLIEPLVGDWSESERIFLEKATKVIVRRERLERGADSR